MKRHIYAFMVLSLCCSLAVLGKEGKDTYFHPLFKKKFSRAKTSSKINSFKVRGVEQRDRQSREVFINWQRLHWGKLSDLIYPREVLAEQTEDSEDLQELTGELRRELKSFEKQFGLKIVWRKRGKHKNCPDVTEEFIEYWDKGISRQKKRGILSLASLSSASAQRLKDKGDIK